MTTTDPFTDAQAEAEARYPRPTSDTRALVYPVAVLRAHARAAFVAGVEWEGDRRAAQEPTDAEVEAAARAMYERGHSDDHPVQWGDAGDNSPVYLADARVALSAARRAQGGTT